MKLNFAMIAIAALLTSLTTAPVFADWDMPTATSVGSTVSSNVANLTLQPVVSNVYSDISGLANSGFDLNTLNPIVSNATAGDATDSQQQPEYTANTTDATRTQAVSTLPECRTSTLADIASPVNGDGLPYCTLSNLATTSSVEGKTEIYGSAGRYGDIDMTGKPNGY